MIIAENLTKYYGLKPAVQNVSFRIEKGEIVGLLGPNGAGKTTILRILTGFFQPTSGKILVDGLNGQTHSLELRKKIGFLPETVPLYDELSVKQFLSFSGTINGLSGNALNTEIDRVISACGLPEHRERRIRHLSKGHKQRVGLAQALINDPPLGILDEPTTGLDPTQIVEVRKLIKDLAPNTTSIQYRDICAKCGARRIDAQIGLESTPAEYVAHIVAVMRECWRVLKDDGTLGLNLGDSYARQAGSDYNKKTDSGMKTGRTGREKELFRQGNNKPPDGLKEKDLVGIPWRVAFALQEDGWYLWSDIIWHKPNPMPESVTDRPTKAHEYVFVMAKSAKYYWDADAVREANLPQSVERFKRLGLYKERWHALAPNCPY